MIRTGKYLSPGVALEFITQRDDHMSLDRSGKFTL